MFYLQKRKQLSIAHPLPPHLVHNGRLSTQTVIRKTEAAPFAAVV